LGASVDFDVSPLSGPGLHYWQRPAQHPDSLEITLDVRESTRVNNGGDQFYS
jgi:hypothetical protein